MTSPEQSLVDHAFCFVDGSMIDVHNRILMKYFHRYTKSLVVEPV